MSARRSIGAMILAAVFVGTFVASGLTVGWLGAVVAWGGALILAPIVIYATILLAGD